MLFSLRVKRVLRLCTGSRQNRSKRAIFGRELAPTRLASWCQHGMALATNENLKSRLSLVVPRPRELNLGLVRCGREGLVRSEATRVQEGRFRPVAPLRCLRCDGSIVEPNIGNDLAVVQEVRIGDLPVVLEDGRIAGPLLFRSMSISACLPRTAMSYGG